MKHKNTTYLYYESVQCTSPCVLQSMVKHNVVIGICIKQLGTPPPYRVYRNAYTYPKGLCAQVCTEMYLTADNTYSSKNAIILIAQYLTT